MYVSSLVTIATREDEEKQFEKEKAERKRIAEMLAEREKMLSRSKKTLKKMQFSCS